MLVLLRLNVLSIENTWGLMEKDKAGKRNSLRAQNPVLDGTADGPCQNKERLASAQLAGIQLERARILQLFHIRADWWRYVQQTSNKLQKGVLQYSVWLKGWLHLCFQSFIHISYTNQFKTNICCKVHIGHHIFLYNTHTHTHTHTHF